MIMLRKSALVALTAALALGACAPAPGASTGAAPSAARSSDPNRLTLAEIESAPGMSTAYDAVQRLRPAWLRVTGARASDGQIAVFQNGTRMGTVEALRQISLEVVGSMRYLDSVDANNQLQVSGMGPIAGAIIVSTRGR
ncbi:hypothetical protein HKM21_10125 [Longimicrobium terrae]|nr:hypothetical protein [Longimicrobium terrae]NNC29628.1 hypothetical protein [Longimicrobium terrae]